jgi:hypothetical protein
MPHELLILSDLHIGGALRLPLGFKALRTVVRLDLELERFLRWFDAHPITDVGGKAKPWTLVLNGDTLDFMHLGLEPDDLTSEDEQLYGPDFLEARSRWKLEQMAAYHRRAFKAFARFIDQGHRMVFVVGNHDADLCFEGVQTDLRACIARWCEVPHRVEAGVEFAPWFYREDGRAWFEHGHRFDPFNTFPDPLAPVPVDGEDRRLSPTFSHWGLRYFVSRVKDFPMHDVETWGPLDFLRWISGKARMGVAQMAIIWAGFLARYVHDTSRVRLRRGQAVRRAHRRKLLRALAQRTRMPVKRLLALDALSLPHVGASIGRLALALYADRLAMGLGAALLIGAAVPVTDSWLGGLVVSLVVIAGLVPLWRWFNRQRPKADTHSVLGRMADRIGRLANAPVVIFGHTHRPVLRRMGHTCWLNPGSWEHVGRYSNRRGPRHATRPTFALITGRGRAVKAALMAWSRIEGRPELVAGDAVTFHPRPASGTSGI